MSKVYLAMYKGKSQDWKKRLLDHIVKIATQGKYSHCELAVDDGNRKMQCYSASLRDGGVRKKRIDLHDGKWDLIPLSWVQPEQIERYFEQTKGAKYDLGGALSVVLPFYNSKGKYFCSEWCATIILGVEHWAGSPTELAQLVINHKISVGGK